MRTCSNTDCRHGLGLVSIKRRDRWYCSERCYRDYLKRCMQEVRIWQFLVWLNNEPKSTS